LKAVRYHREFSNVGLARTIHCKVQPSEATGDLPDFLRKKIAVPQVQCDCPDPVLCKTTEFDCLLQAIFIQIEQYELGTRFRKTL
jgi:hypothetical protein